MDNEPRAEHGLLSRLKWGDPSPSLHCAHFSSPSAPHFLLRPFSQGSRFHSLSFCFMLSLVFFVSALAGFSLFICQRFHIIPLISIISISPSFSPSELLILALVRHFLSLYPLFISFRQKSTPTFALSIPPSFCLSFHPISPPPAVAEDDKPPYTMLCAQAALDKSCSVEGVGVGAGWGPQRNGFNLNYSS